MKNNTFKLLLHVIIFIVPTTFTMTACSTITASSKQNFYTEENESIVNLQKTIFLGGGEWIVTGGLGLLEYFMVFGMHYNFVPGHVIGIVDNNEFMKWRNQFADMSVDGWRDPREFHLGAVIDEFNITREQFIRAHEQALFGRSIEEIDNLVTLARSTNVEEIPGEELSATFWRNQFSLSDIDALFSNDIHKLWERFPGSGVFYNGMAFSPEWIVHNMDVAIHEKYIPIEEIENVFERLSSYYEIVAKGQAALHAEIAVFDSLEIE